MVACGGLWIECYDSAFRHAAKEIGEATYENQMIIETCNFVVREFSRKEVLTLHPIIVAAALGIAG